MTDPEQMPEGVDTPDNQPAPAAEGQSAPASIPAPTEADTEADTGAAPPEAQAPQAPEEPVPEHPAPDGHPPEPRSPELRAGNETDEPFGEGDDASPEDAAPPGPATLSPPEEDGVRTGDRIAKVMARSGVASRRDAERMILEGRVKVNGAIIKSPALDVLPSDRIVVDGTPLDAPQETRVWLYYKPVGLVTSEADEKGRQTIFDALPRDLPRVMTVGRLDLTSEGLLLLTNDGELKRRLELPATAWMRKYRVRVNGQPNELTFGPLRRGIEIEGEQFQPMEVEIDSQQGANAWLTVGIREGKNREIRRAMAHVGLTVNRLIRIGYGPFRLTGLEKNEVREVKRRVLRDQLGGLLTGEAEADASERGYRGGDRGGDRGAERGGNRGDRPRAFGHAGGMRDRDDRPPRPRPVRDDADRGPRPGGFGARQPRAEGADRPDRPRWKNDGERPDRGPRPGGFGARPPRAEGADRPDRPARWADGARKLRASDQPPRDGAKPDRPRWKDAADRPAQGGGKPWQAGAGPRPARADDAGERKPRPSYGADRARPWQDRGAGDGPDRGETSRKPRFGAEGERAGERSGERKPRHGAAQRADARGEDAARPGADERGRSFGAPQAARGGKPGAFRDRAGDFGDAAKGGARGGKPGGFGDRAYASGAKVPRGGADGARPGKPGGFGERGRSGGPRPAGGGQRPRGGPRGGKPDGGPRDKG